MEWNWTELICTICASCKLCCACMLSRCEWVSTSRRPRCLADINLDHHVGIYMLKLHLLQSLKIYLILLIFDQMIHCHASITAHQWKILLQLQYRTSVEWLAWFKFAMECKAYARAVCNLFDQHEWQHACYEDSRAGQAKGELHHQATRPTLAK